MHVDVFLIGVGRNSYLSPKTTATTTVTTATATVTTATMTVTTATATVTTVTSVATTSTITTTSLKIKLRLKVRAEYYTSEIAIVKFHWKMPLSIHWTIPVKILWKSDNPLEQTTAK